MQGKKMQQKHKRFVDEIFTNGMNQALAYRTVFKVTNDNYSKVAACRLLKRPEVAAYYNHKMKEYRESLEIDKQKMTDLLKDTMNDFLYLKNLAKQGKLTAEQESIFARLMLVLKASDALKAADMINKLQGNYEPDKIEHSGIKPIQINIIDPTKKEKPLDEPEEGEEKGDE